MDLYNISNAETGVFLAPVAAKSVGDALTKFAQMSGYPNYGALSRAEDVTLTAVNRGPAHQTSDGGFVHDWQPRR